MKERRWLLAALSVLLFIAAWPERGWPFLIFGAWVPLFYLSDLYRQTSRKYFFPLLYLVFFIFNGALTYWIWFATPAGAVFAVSANALLMTLTFWIWHRLRWRLPYNMGLALFPPLWILFEKMHYLWDLEWPWLTMGNVFAAHPEHVQWYAYTGVFGGTAWILAVNIKIFTLLQRRRRYLLVDTLLLLTLPLFWSRYLYTHYQEQGQPVRVLLLQPNINPWTEKFTRPNRVSMDDLIQMAEPYADSVDLIIAPETALARLTDKNRIHTSPFYLRLKEFFRRHPHSAWLIGASLYNYVDENGPVPSTANRSSNGRWYQLYNSALFITADTLAMYHKSILVPGAEKMPFRKFVSPILGDIILDLGGASGTHTPSPGAAVFSVPSKNIRIAPIICYESIFGDYVRQYVQKGANLLAVITNDGWWKKTGGYRQHFHYARLRAVETRRDVVRAANTGRSGHINQRGDVMAYLPYNRRGALVVTPRLNNRPTFYVRYGDYIPRIALFVAAVLLIYAFGKKRVKL